MREESEAPGPIEAAIRDSTLKHERTESGADLYSGTVTINGKECFVIIGHKD